MASVYNFIREVYTELFPSTELREHRLRVVDDISEAESNASQITFMLSVFKSEVKKRYPYRDDVITTVNRVTECLSDEHGGLDPLLFLYKFESQIYDCLTASALPSSQEGKAFKEIVGRWSNTTQIRKEFSFLKAYNQRGECIYTPKNDIESRQITSTYATEEDALKTAEAMQKWIQNRYGTIF
ncbi:hypothetical protein MferCBS31731_005018 [Microsporum ferrugineum]